jgi:multiple sugar transport system ATP-binding protein
VAGLTLDALSKAYGDAAPVLREVSLAIADGEFCVFIGPSGCGKSTLLRMIAGLEDITGGELRIGGTRVNERAPSQRDVAMVFQSYALYPHMTVADNIAFGLGLAGVAKTEISRRVAHIAQMLQIEPLLARKPAALSGGQRQRVAIGRALVREPGVFLFDEPLSNLDAALRTQTRVEIARLHRQYGRAAAIYVTHDQVEAMTLADKIVLLRSGPDVRLGSVAQVGSPLELYETPANLFAAGFIGSPKMNFLPVTLVSADAAGAELQTTEGLRLRAALDADRIERGAPLTLGIRSEHLKLAAPGADGALPASVQWVERLGDVSYAYLEVANAPQPVVVRTEGNAAVRDGEAVALVVPPSACHGFDAEGLALRRLPGEVGG